MAADDDTAHPDAPPVGGAQALQLPSKIVVPLGLERVSVDFALTVLIAVGVAAGKLRMPTDKQRPRNSKVPASVILYAKLGADGGPVGEVSYAPGDDSALKDAIANAAMNLAEADAVEIFAQLNIKPRNSIAPLADYVGGPMQNALFEITVEEWARLAAAYDVPFEIASVPDAQTTGRAADAQPIGNLPDVALRPIQRQAAQEAHILEVIRTLRVDPMALDMKPGRRGAKSRIREICLAERSLFTLVSFDKAWQRLRSQGRISDAQ
jgi:hypothetical protein